MNGQINTRNYTNVNAYSEMIIALREADRIARNWNFESLHQQLAEVLARTTATRDRLAVAPTATEADEWETIALTWSEESTHARTLRIPKGYNPEDDPNIYNELAMLDDPGLVNFDRFAIRAELISDDLTAEEFVPAAARNSTTEEDEPTS